MTRREFARLATLAAGGVATAALATPIVGFLLTPLFRRQVPSVEREIGNVSGLAEASPTLLTVRFPEGEWSAAEDEHSLYVVRAQGGYRVFSTVCTHMQCDVHWAPDLRMFLCPCHGGLYNLEGENVGGPPPKPLPEYQHRIAPDGTLYVSNRLSERI